MRIILCVICLALPVFAKVSPPLLAQESGDERARELMRQGRFVPYNTIARRAEQMFEGRVVGQEVLTIGPDRYAYDLHILRPDGRVIEALFDAMTGELIGTEGRRR